MRRRDFVAVTMAAFVTLSVAYAQALEYIAHMNGFEEIGSIPGPTAACPREGGVASSRPPSTRATVRRATGSYARQTQSLQVFF